MISINQAPKPRSSIEKTRKQLKALSNRELLGSLEKLTHRERRLKILVLLYLAEIDTRQLYLPMGYSSLFDFCTMHLRYTRATAGRRIRAARAAAKYPDALDMLRSGEINITTLSMIGDILDPDNHAELLDAIRNKSTRRVEMLVSQHRPMPVIRDTVRPVCVRRRIEVPTAPPAGGSSAGTGGQNPSPIEDTGGRKSNKISLSAETRPSRSGDALNTETNVGRSGNIPSAEADSGSKGRVILEQRLKLGFSVSHEFMIKYNKIKALLSNKHPEGLDFETLFEHLMDEYLEKHDPERKQARRIKRTQRRKQTVRSERGKKESVSRCIPPAVRDKVYARDKGRCTFIGANGKRCNSTWDLELDHIVPYSRNGDNSPDNLRLLCRKHNIHQAERAYGREFMNNRSKRE